VKRAILLLFSQQVWGNRALFTLRKVKHCAQLRKEGFGVQELIISRGVSKAPQFTVLLKIKDEGDTA